MLHIHIVALCIKSSRTSSRKTNIFNSHPNNRLLFVWHCLPYLGCKNSVGADIIFVLDGSGSIGTANFNSIKTFVMDVINGFDVGADKTRFGVIKFRYALAEVI